MAHLGLILVFDSQDPDDIANEHQETREWCKITEFEFLKFLVAREPLASSFIELRDDALHTERMRARVRRGK